MANIRSKIAFSTVAFLVLAGVLGNHAGAVASSLPPDPYGFGRLGVHSYYLTPFDQKIFEVTNLYNGVTLTNHEEFVLYAGGLRNGSSGVKLYSLKAQIRKYIGTYLYPGIKLLTAFEMGREVGLADSKHSIYLAFDPIKHTFRRLRNLCSWGTVTPMSYRLMNMQEKSFIKKYFLSKRVSSLKLDPKMQNVRLPSAYAGWHECVNLPIPNSNDFTPNSDDTTSTSGWEGWVPLSATKAFRFSASYKNNVNMNKQMDQEFFGLVVVKGKYLVIASYSPLLDF